MRVPACLFLLVATAAGAEEETARLGAPGVGLRVGVRAVRGVRLPGASGFVRVSFTNEGGVERGVRAVLRTPDPERRIRVERRARVPAGDIAVVYLPLLGAGREYRLEVAGAGHAWETHAWTGLTSTRPVVLGVAPTEAVAARRRGVLEDVVRGVSLQRPRWRHVEAAHLPPDWRLLTGFRLLVLGGADAGWSEARQETVLGALEAGARVVVFRAGALPQGPLRRVLAVARDELRAGRRGFGSFLALGFDRDGLARRTAVRGDDLRRVRAWLHDPAEGRAVTLAGGLQWLPPAFYRGAPIPGVGDVPVRAFFVLILGFAILVGPVAYLWLRRRRRLTLMVAVLPGAGFALTAAILLFGFFSEGFGLKGVVHSVTLLDQRTHVATTAATRTLYAGLSPNALEPGPGTHLACPALAGSSTPHVYAHDGDRLDGALVPSRTPTPLVTLQRGRARERIKLRRRGDGWEVLAGESFAPLPGALLFRDFDGRWWRDTGAGRLAPLDGAPAGPLAELRAALLAGVGADPARRTRAGTPLPLWIAALTRTATAPGSYVARVRNVPSLDGLGLDVEHVAREHLVIGRLAREDVVE